MTDNVVGNNALSINREPVLREMISSVRAVFELSSDGIIVLSEYGECLLINPVARSIFGADGTESFCSNYKNALLAQSSEEFKLKITNKDNQKCIVDIISRKMPWGSFNATVFTIRDIDTTSDSELVETEKRLSEIVDDINGVLYTLDEDRHILYISKAITKLSGIDASEYIGKPFSELIAKDRSYSIDEVTQEALSISEDVVEFRLQTSDRKLKWVQRSFYDDISSPGNGSKELKGILLDITQRKQSEKDLRNSEALYRTIFETSAAGTILYNYDMTIALANEKLAEISGYSIEDMLNGRKWSEVMADGERARVLAYFRRRFANTGKYPATYEFRLRRKDGEMRDIVISTALVPGTTQGVASLIDITEAKQKSTVYQTIIEQSLFGVVVMRGSKVQFVNQYAANMVGYSIDELLKFKDDEFNNMIHEDHRMDFVRQLRTLIVGKPANHSSLFKISKKDNTVRWLEAYSTIIEYEGQKSILLLGHDVSERVEIMERNRQNEERYRIISDVISDYAYSQVVHEDGSWTSDWISDSVIRITDHVPEQPLFSWIDHVVEQDRNIVETHIANTLKGKSDIAEFRVRTRDGETKWLREYCKPITDEQSHRVVKYYAVGQDITERRQMRQALHEFERRFRVMLENLSMISVILDTRGKMVFCNDYLLELTQYKRDELLSIDWFSTFIPEKSRNEMASLYKATLRDGLFPVNMENEILTRAGERRLIKWTNTVLRDTKGSVIGTASIGEDITDMRRAETQLRDSEERYRQLFTIEPDALIVHDYETQEILEANKAMLAMYGYTREEVIGLPMMALSAEPEKTRKFIKEMDKLKTRKIPLRYHKKKDGTVFPVEISAGLFIHDKRKMVYAAARDISERVKADSALIEAKERVELSDKLKDSFIANMSHEIRTPLNIIMGFTGIIESGIGDILSDEQRDYFRSVERAGDRLQRTVEQLLNLSSMQAGAYAPSFNEFDISNQVDHLVSDMISLAQAKGLALEILHEEPSLQVSADKYLVEQTIANIIDNAIKFTKNGGVFVRVFPSKQYATIEVKDTGIGISEEYLPSLFSMFSQEVIGYTRPFDGLGLGLALSKMYADEFGGRIRVSSVKGSGTIIQVDVPLAKAANRDDQSEPFKRLRSGSLSKERSILVIEDDVVTQRYLDIALQDFNLIHASNTEEALHVLSGNEVDMIFLDRHLKGTFDGIHCAEIIKSNTQTSRIPIVVLSSHEQADDKKRCDEAGCSGFITKPIQKGVLESIISKVIPDRSE
jgi:PAS domain S-box-containing protein